MKRFWIAIAVMALAGCKSGKNYQGIEVEVPDAYRFAETVEQVPEDFLFNTDSLSTDSLLGINWFELFDDPVLDSLVQQALDYNQDLLIAAENINQAHDGLVVQRSAMLPQVGVQAGTIRGNFQQGIILPEAQNVLFGAGFVNWEIDFWGKYRRLNEVAKAEIVRSEEGYRAAKISLTAGVANAYFSLLEYEAKLEISERNLALRDSMLHIIEQRFDKGIIAEIDLNQAQIKRAIAAESIPVWKRQIAKTQNLISVLTGANPRAIETGINLNEQDTLIEIPAGLPSELLMRRPDVIAAEYQLVAQNAFIGVAKANRLPNISLTGILGVASADLSGLASSPMIYNVGSSLFAPLFNFGKLQRQVDISESQYQQAVLNYERTLIEAFRSVEDALIDVSTLKEELIARKAHVVAALNAQRLSQARYNEGATSYLEYLESQRQAFESELNYVGTKQQLLSAYANLYKALGGGW